MTYRIEANFPMTLSHLQDHSLLQAFRCDFCTRDAMLARYWLSSRVRLSVRLSQARVVPKRLRVVSRKQRYMIAYSVQGLCSFIMQNISTKSRWNHLIGCAKCKWGR